MERANKRLGYSDIYRVRTKYIKARLGETKIMNCGMEATIIRYKVLLFGGPFAMPYVF